MPFVCNHFLWLHCTILETNWWSLNKTCLVEGEKGNKVASIWGKREQRSKLEKRLALCSAPVELSDSMTCSSQQHSWALCLCPIYSLAHPAPALWQPYHGAGGVTWAEEVHHQTHLQHTGQQEPTNPSSGHLRIHCEYDKYQPIPQLGKIQWKLRINYFLMFTSLNDIKTDYVGDWEWTD